MAPSASWTPSADRIEHATLTRYLRWLDRGFRDYHELWAWSVADIEGFWASLWDFFEIEASSPYSRVLDRHEMPGATWFAGAELSYAEHVFRGHADDAIALVHASEVRDLSQTTWGELRLQTARIAAGLRALGVVPGDRVVAYMPNIPETVAAFLAAASVGAIWSSAAPEFGLESVADRFSQIEPRVLLATDGYRYGGRDVDRRETIARLRDAIPSLEHAFVLPYVGAASAGEADWADLERPATGLQFEQLPFDHPLWVLYSSGTTGLPKAIVHGQGGILLEHLKTLRLHFDLHADDRLFWFTTTGWMMWNLLVGGLLTEAPIVLYDGSPGTPDINRLWDLAEAAGITCFGTSAAYISACMKAGVEPARGRDLSRLRSVGSTGSPLSPEGFRWVSEQLGEQTWLFSTSGGTDVCSAFVGGVPTLPVYEGELQARSLGAKVEAFDDQGRSVIDEIGELVLTEPLPSMPLYLWGDDGSRYAETYFSTFPGVWRHGDWIEITSRGTAIIYGRSDATINRGGVRMGTNEIYRGVLALPEIVDAVVVDIPRPGADGTSDGQMHLFVVLVAGAELDQALRDRIKRQIREFCSPRHVPDEIHEVAAVPRTLSGKVLEVPIKRILTGTPPAEAVSIESLANPESLAYFAELARTLT
jgi:acetoacetyl-CoA synthetase